MEQGEIDAVKRSNIFNDQIVKNIKLLMTLFTNGLKNPSLLVFISMDKGNKYQRRSKSRSSQQL